MASRLPGRGLNQTKARKRKAIMNKMERQMAMVNRLQGLGLSFDEAQALRRIEMTLHRWGELECGDSDNYKSWAIERDEATGKPFMGIYPYSGKSYRVPVADREAGALKRLGKIMAKHPELRAYHQTDPRGCALYVLRDSDLNGQPIDQVYTRGVAVCS